jgi:NAD(P)-dependent dehydrogenase (short-subunit alcohol dehydrogenase family)
MTETDRAAREILALTDRIDVLVNNAGGTSAAIAMTGEGNEAVFASNHLAPFLLTARLLPALQRAAEGGQPGRVRILNVSSSAHESSAGLDWDDLQSVGNYVPILAYCNAKLANVLFTRLLATRLDGSGIVAHAVHPGAVDSNFYAYADAGTQEFARTTELISPQAGADTVIWLASADEPGRATGAYYAERAQVTPSALATDDASAQRLWRESEQLLARNLGEPGFHFP